MGNQTKCRCGKEDHAHLCMLRSNGMHDDIEKITSDPHYYCFVCGGESHCAENLCEPAEIE